MIQLIDQDEVVGTSTHKEIMRSYKYELKPTRKQEVILNKTIGICRHLYNTGLEQRKKAYEKGGWSINYSDQQNQLPELRQKCSEYNTIHSQVLQNVLRRLDISMKNFFRRIKNNNADSGKYEKPGFPRFKGYGRYDSFTFPQYGNGCDIRGKNNDIIRLSKIGEIKFIKHREIEGIVKIVTIKKEVDKFFVIFVTQQYVEIPSPKQYINIEELNSRSIGIDMGLSNLATLSNGKKIEAPKYLKKSLKKLRREQRRLSRKKRYDVIDPKTNKPKRDQANKKIKKNSNNREKQRIKVAKVHRKITNQRRNFNHEVSRTLVNNFDLIVFEDLSIQRMMQDRRYSRGIADSGWSQIQMFTKYKAE